jgi:hypothetical protein
MASGSAVIARHPAKLSMSDVMALCDRMKTRAMSVELRDKPELTTDMLLSSEVMRILWTRAYNSSDQLTVPT